MAALKPMLLSARRPRIGVFDGFVLAGAGINLVVVAVLLVHWLVR